MKKIDILKFNWGDIQSFHNYGNDKSKIIKKFGLSRKILNRGISEGLLKYSQPKRKLTDEEKNKISVSRIEYLKNNPDSHPWKRKGKQKSVPCEKLKTILRNNGLVFNEEYTPLESNRFYSMDISFIKNKIGVEVNGNQHYNLDGSLKEYYRIRHEHFTSLGWKIIEVHYSKVYIEEYVKNLITYLKTLDEYSYDELIEFNSVIKFKKDKKIKYCDCGNEILNTSIICRKCYYSNRRKVIRPEYEILINEVIKNGYSATGRKYGVSDNAIRKWLKHCPNGEKVATQVLETCDIK
jgi:hypothetical protein